MEGNNMEITNMNMGGLSKNLFFLSNIGVKKSNFSKTAAKLWSVILALALAGVHAQAATNEPPAKEVEKEPNIVAVFRLDGPVTEVPAEETLSMFGAPGTSLKELVAGLHKAAEDSDVKAVVVMPESTTLGPGQVEELREAMSVVRSHGKPVYVHADSLMMGEYVLGLRGASQHRCCAGQAW